MDAKNDPKLGRFQLRRTQGEKTELEWEFGQEPDALFQLHSPFSAPADFVAAPNGEQPFVAPSMLRAPAHSRPTNPFAAQRSTRGNPDDSRWQRPSIEGEIVEPEQASPSPADQPAARAQTEPADATVADPFASWQRPAATASATDPLSSAPYNGRANGEQSVRDVAPHPPPRGRQPSTRQPHSTRGSLVELFAGAEGMKRVLTTRMALDDALDQWWTHNQLAPLALLRDGLLVLEAGHDLDETQRTFLLRTALRTGRGVVTALRHQLDADRTAFLIKDALLDTRNPLDPQFVNALRTEDEQSKEWADYLEHDLAYEATVATGKRSQLAAAALHVLQHPHLPVNRAPFMGANSGRTVAPVGIAAATSRLDSLRRWGRSARAGMAPTTLLPLSHRWSLRWLLWGCLLLLLLLNYNWPPLYETGRMIQIPGGTYLVSDPTTVDPAAAARFQSVTLSAYQIDQREVSNAAYRRCWEQNICPIPTSFDSQSRPGYFANRSYDDFPVVNVDWQAANTYCAWVGKRLPTMEEWEVAASLAPATGRRFTYPWGDRFDERLVNGGTENNPGDTLPSGTFHPTGSTSTGIMDMAGNVAEWTAMPAAAMIDGFVVKGGSFQDAPKALRNNAMVEVQQESSAPWLGFRCVRSGS